VIAETNEPPASTEISGLPGARPEPLAQGAFSEAPVSAAAPAQIQIVQNVPLLPVGTTVLGAPGPGGRPTLIVDTSSAAMGELGLPALELPPAARAPNLGNQGSARNRNVTRRVQRGNNGPGIFNQVRAEPAPSASAKITVNKLG
jgi:hypothetical protein